MIKPCDNCTIEQKVKQYVLRETFVEADKIQDDTLIFKEGFFDSMGFIKLITFIEEEFNIRTSDTDLVEDNFESIKAIALFINRKSQ